jgi:hypothetical protein
MAWDVIRFSTGFHTVSTFTKFDENDRFESTFGRKIDSK